MRKFFISYLLPSPYPSPRRQPAHSCVSGPGVWYDRPRPPGHHGEGWLRLLHTLHHLPPPQGRWGPCQPSVQPATPPARLVPVAWQCKTLTKSPDPQSHAPNLTLINGYQQLDVAVQREYHLVIDGKSFETIRLHFPSLLPRVTTS